MMDEGYLNNDPRFRLEMRKIRLRLLANAILDVKMQTMGMTDAQAMDSMTKDAFQTQAEADGSSFEKLAPPNCPPTTSACANGSLFASEIRRPPARISTC